MGFVEAAEAVEGGEELVVAAKSRGGDEAAHGEGVDEAIIEVLIRRRNIAGELRGGNQLCLAGGRGELERCGVDAHAVFSGVAEECLSIDGAGKVDMEVCALGKLHEKRLESERALCGVGLVGAGGASFGFGNATRRFRAGGGEEKETSEDAGYASHDCIPV